MLHNDKPVVVDFWATWCGPCKMVAPEMEKLAAKYEGLVDVVKVDVDANPRLSQAFNIMSIPTIAFFKPGAAAAGRRRLPAAGAAGAARSGSSSSRPGADQHGHRGPGPERVTPHTAATPADPTGRRSIPGGAAVRRRSALAGAPIREPDPGLGAIRARTGRPSAGVNAIQPAPRWRGTACRASRSAACAIAGSSPTSSRSAASTREHPAADRTGRSTSPSPVRARRRAASSTVPTRSSSVSSPSALAIASRVRGLVGARAGASSSRSSVRRRRSVIGAGRREDRRAGRHWWSS